MTESSELMKQLRAAWRASVATKAEEHADLSAQEAELKALGMTAVRPVSLKLSFPTCESHLDPTGWRREPVPDRPGWLLTTCVRCGRFIGYGRTDKIHGTINQKPVAG